MPHAARAPRLRGPAGRARRAARAYERGTLSARGHHRVLRVARTIADLAGARRASGSTHVLEAIALRNARPATRRRDARSSTPCDACLRRTHARRARSPGAHRARAAASRAARAASSRSADDDLIAALRARGDRERCTSRASAFDARRRAGALRATRPRARLLPRRRLSRAAARRERPARRCCTSPATPAALDALCGEPGEDARRSRSSARAGRRAGRRSRSRGRSAATSRGRRPGRQRDGARDRLGGPRRRARRRAGRRVAVLAGGADAAVPARASAGCYAADPQRRAARSPRCRPERAACAGRSPPATGSSPRSRRPSSSSRRSERSGSLITADIAADLGRAVAAVPGPVIGPRSAGTNALLHDGAAVVRDARDALDLMAQAPRPLLPRGAVGAAAGRDGPHPRRRVHPRRRSTTRLRRALDAVDGGADRPDRLARVIGGDVAVATIALTRLELAGFLAPRARRDLRPEGGRVSSLLLDSRGVTARRPVPVVLSIAGSDSGGGAGIQADLKAFAAAGVHGTTAITAITVQNTVAVSGVHPVPPDIVRAQIRAVAEDLGVDAVKIGMLGDVATIRAVAEALDALPGDPPVVHDPVMVAESGARLLPEDAGRGPAHAGAAAGDGRDPEPHGGAGAGRRRRARRRRARARRPRARAARGRRHRRPPRRGRRPALRRRRPCSSCPASAIPTAPRTGRAAPTRRRSRPGSRSATASRTPRRARGRPRPARCGTAFATSAPEPGPSMSSDCRGANSHERACVLAGHSPGAARK